MTTKMAITQEQVLNQLRQKVLEVSARIKSDKYYTSIWSSVSHTKPLNECTRVELLKPFQDFWELLPDSAGVAIRRGPFFVICDLAEAYCFGDEDDGVDN